MGKPSLLTSPELLPHLKPYYTKFDAIDFHETLLPTMAVESSVNVVLATAPDVAKLSAEELLAELKPSEFHQSFLVVAADYGMLRSLQVSGLPGVLSSGKNVRVVYAGDALGAIKYAVGLVEKCAKNGALDLRPASN